MSDPLGLIGSSGRVPAPRPDFGPAPGGVEKPSFKDALLRNIDEINKLQQDAVKAVEDLQTGKRTDLEGVMIATTKADTAFKMLQSVRNQVIKAYEDIQQMRV
jgi:flagellar hook-basal body complex protein FliE